MEWSLILMGVLLFGIIAFFTFQWVNGRMKAKKAKAAKIKFEKDQEEAKQEVIAMTMAIIKQNDDNLKRFVVSIGKYKMIDINQFAKKAIKKIQTSTNYELFFRNEEFPMLADVDAYLNKLRQTKSNLWDKKCLIEMEYFDKHEKELWDQESYQEIRNKSIDLIKEDMEKFKYESTK